MEVNQLVRTFVGFDQVVVAGPIPYPVGCRFNAVIHHRLSQSFRLSMVPVIVEYALDEDLGELFEIQRGIEPVVSLASLFVSRCYPAR